jgi:hypothetical protein
VFARDLNISGNIDNELFHVLLSSEHFSELLQLLSGSNKCEIEACAEALVEKKVILKLHI